MRKIGNRTCGKCGSVWLVRRQTGMEQHAEKPIYCRACQTPLDWTELGEQGEPQNTQSGLAKQLKEMDPDEL